MAALVVQSRFAGLKIEDDDFPSSSEGSKTKKAKPAAVKKVEPPKKSAKTNNNANKNQNASKKKKVKQPATAQQWETWKQKDEELVDGHFETELQQAILLSKLDYEEKKDIYKQTKKDVELEKKQAERAKNGKKKKNVMSLDQFNDMINGEPNFQHQHEKPTPEDRALDRDTEFFERVKDETKNELLKDKINDRVRNRPQVTDEVITRSQFAQALEKKDKEIAALKVEIMSLKEELLTVKSRNKKLCSILGQGEMKDKAEVLVEVERLRGVQAELTAELEALHRELQRERSRPEPRAKDKKKKSGDKEK